MTDSRRTGAGKHRSDSGLDPVEDAVAACLALPGDERGPAVEAACARQPEIAQAIRERVRALERIGLLDPPAGGGARTAPSRLGEFELIEELGGGGMGVVYLAEQTTLHRRVALKLIRPELLFFGDSRARFRREVEAVARLQHPGIVPVYAVGEENGLPYFAMEHIAGCTLAEVLVRLSGRDPERLTGRDLLDAVRAAAPHAAAPDGDAAPLFDGAWEQVCLRIVQQAADALHHAHERGILHRDVKPSNIMLTASGRVLLVDFGLARAEDASSLTRTGSQIGSLPYMSPEQVRGVDRSLDRRTDVYSLGVTLFELLTLRCPYDGADTTLVREKIVHGEHEPARRLHRALSWEADAICATAMEPDPARRYATAADFSRDIDNVLCRRPIRARRAGVVLRARRWAQRQPARATAIALVSVVLVGGPSLFAWQQARELERTRGLQLTAASGAALAGDPALALALAIEGARANPGREAENALSVALNACYEEMDVAGDPDGLGWVEFSPDGRSFLAASSDGPAADGRPRAYAVRIFDAASGERLAVLAGHADGIKRAHFSPDGTLVVSASLDGTARVWDVASGRLVRVLTGHGDGLLDARFDPAGLRVATVSLDCDARVWTSRAGLSSS